MGNTNFNRGYCFNPTCFGYSLPLVVHLFALTNNSLTNSFAKDFFYFNKPLVINSKQFKQPISRFESNLEYFKNIKSDKVHLLEILNVKFIIREITWKEGLLIDAKSFRKKDWIIKS